MTGTKQPKGALLFHDFISSHRKELIDRARTKVALRPAPRATHDELANGVPLFLTQLTEILRQEAAHSAPDGAPMGKSATQHGGDLLEQGFSIAQVVQDYGDVCQAITELALELHVPVATKDFQILNRCLDSAIASAVTEYVRQHDVDLSGAEIRRQGFFAHELRNQLNTALLALQVLKSGRVGVTGSTTAVLERSLYGLRDLVDRSLSQVRLGSGTYRRERLSVSTFVEEMKIDATIDATSRGLQFIVEPVDDNLFVDVDRALFASAVSNLLHNAFKFTRPSSQVWLRVHSAAGRLVLEVEDQCGGLPAGASEVIFRPFEQRGADRAGLGLGLAISRRAIEANGGGISLQDLPGRGCVFFVELPLSTADRPMAET